MTDITATAVELGFGSRVFDTCVEKLMTDWYVMRESVETAHSTVNRLVFSRAT